MIPGLSLKHLAGLWDCFHLKYAILELPNRASLMISERGGRILGPFFDVEEEGFLWLNLALQNQESFQQFLREGDWNLGGERNWIGPEIQYLYQDRTRIVETTVIPDQMDPGNFSLKQVGTNCWRLENELTLQTFNTAFGAKKLGFESTIQPAADPLRHLRTYDQFKNKFQFAGYEQVTRLVEEGTNEIMSCTWNILQIKPPGQVIIPVTPGCEVTNYETQPVDSNYQAIHENYISLRITGEKTYKTGYKSAHLTGRIGYIQEKDNGQAVLLVRNFYNNPSSDYFEEAYNLPGEWGSSLFIYNDGGSYGGYGEIECFGQTIGGQTGRSSSIDPMQVWLYTGGLETIKLVTRHLLGIRI